MATPGRPGIGQPLPAELSSFIGRRHDLGEVRRLLSTSRLVTLVGPGGVGKTRLANRAAADLRRSFPDGTAFAELATVRDPALVVRQAAGAMDVRDDSGRWLVAGLAAVVGERHLLLVLDNCEHLRDASAVLVDAMLSSCPRLRVLATSRHPLDVDGEALLVVPPLSAPREGTGQDAFSYDAVQLLVERARTAVPALELTPADGADLGELCRRLDGNPLAIELAAVRLRTLSPADIVTRLDDRFRLLQRASAAVPERHRTLRATMRWSYDLLAEPERLLWLRAAVFAGDFDLSAAESVGADHALPADSVLDALTRLVETSVLEVRRRADTPRFGMLETVRAFGSELLEDSGDAQSTRTRHRDWCAGLASDAAEEFLGPNQVAAFDRLATHHAELSAALTFCVGTPGEQEVGLGIASDLWLYWEARGRLGEGRRLLDVLLAGSPRTSPARARGLAVAGFLALGATDPDAALPLLQEAAQLAEDDQQPFAAAMATQYLGQAALFQGDLKRAEQLLREAAARHRELDPHYSAFCMADVGVVALLVDSFEVASAAFHESLDLNAGGDPWTRSHAQWGLGLVRLRTGDTAQAAQFERDALRIMREVDDRSGIALCVEALAWVAAAQQDWDGAARLTGAAEATWRSIPAELPAPLAPYQAGYSAEIHRALGETRWSARYGEGCALDRHEAISAALGETSPKTAPAPTPSGQVQTPAPTLTLTKRQREVAALVARGLTDREIAAQLVISPRTAESHVEQILTRLGFRSRTEIAAWSAAPDR